MKWLIPRRSAYHRITLHGLGLAMMILAPALALAIEPSPTRPVILERADVPPRPGAIVGSAATGFNFLPAGDEAAIPLSANDVITFPAGEPASGSPRPPFQLLIGQSMRLSGTLKEFDPTTIRFSVPWDGRSFRSPRSAASAVVQVAGESRILADGFEGLDPARWSVVGSPSIVETEHVGGLKSLQVAAGENAITHNLADPLISGRLDLAFHDSGKIVAGNRCGVELSFRGPSGLKVLRIDLGWQEESLTVESSGGPALAVQHLARVPGWHRLSARFNAETTEISVDGKELANGKGIAGPLTAIRLGSSTSTSDRGRSAVERPSCYFDELQLIRYAEPPNSLEIDPTQDEARLTVGDQLFGVVGRANSDRIAMSIDARPVDLPWSEVSGLYFRRTAAMGMPIEGTLVRVEWAPGTGAVTRDLDFAEGALAEVSGTSISLATPYAETLVLPRSLVQTVRILGKGRRIVFDVSSHHLGDAISVEPPLLDPPLPEGSALDRVVELPAAIDGASFLSLDVLQVVGEAPGLPFSDFIRKGELRTYVVIGGKRVDYLNRHIKSRNETVERIRIPIPSGMLRAGKNLIRIEQTATSDDPTGFDDLGILEMALEIDPKPDSSPSSDLPTRPRPNTPAPEKP